MRDRLDALSEEVRALRGAGGPAQPSSSAAVPAAAPDAADGALYVAFENAFRGSPDDIRERLRDYVPLFAGAAPVADLGCGRGEFLELLREAGIEGRGVEGNAHSASACRAAGLDVTHGDLLEYLRQQPDGALGGVFAAQVAEHLPPPSPGHAAPRPRALARPGSSCSRREPSSAAALRVDTATSPTSGFAPYLAVPPPPRVHRRTHRAAVAVDAASRLRPIPAAACRPR